MRVLMRRADEQGSIVFVLMIIVVLCTIGTVMTSRVVGNEQVVVSRQSNAAAVSLADGGLADALFRIDQGTAGTGTGSYFCVNSSDNNCVAASVPAAPGVSYVARQSGSTSWTIQSVATANGQNAAVQETVTRSVLYPFALFGETSLTFNGNAGQAFATYSSSEPPSSSTSPPNPNPAGAIAVGSNGPINCDGGLGSNVTVVYYGTGGVGSTQSSSCGTYQSHANTFYLATPTAPQGALTCPGNGQMGSNIVGAPTLLPPGTYLCTTPITINGQLNVSGPVQLYVILDPTIYGSSTNAVTIIGGSYVNDQADYCTAHSGASGCSPTPDLPTAENLQLFSNTTGTVGNDNGNSGYWFGGIMYIPYGSLTQDGCRSVYYGSVIINTLTCNSGPHLSVSYDQALQSVYGPWVASGYLQLNPSTVFIP